MSKKLLVATGIIIILLLLVGGGVFYLSRSHTATPKPVTKNTASPTQGSKLTTLRKSLLDLLSVTGNQQCTFSDKKTGGSGTVYTGSGNVRGDFLSQSNSTNSNLTKSHMITDGKYIYFWTEGNTKGYKMALDVISQMSSNEAGLKSQTLDMQKQVDYTCNPWTVDKSEFTLPSTVTFTDYTSMMQGVMKSNGAGASSATVMPGNSAACGQCSNLPANAQAACRAALKC